MPNRLIHETSPYLLQHAHNPVDWYPWSEQALQRARAEDKPIFLSIGYAACHWCHVMERESFQDEATAALLNEHFIPIKVDREERPDLDAIYMNAVVMLTGQGGWPLSVFLTPTGVPFFGGTYFPPVRRYNLPAFTDVLRAVVDAWRTRRAHIESAGGKILQALQTEAWRTTAAATLEEQTLMQALAHLQTSFDWANGGWGDAPKFPQPMALEFLMRRYVALRDPLVLKMITTTLDRMARGGIYDQLGGGFHRYATDAIWLVPHFEKMLYDNAQLARVYVYAWQITRNDFYRRIAEQTLDYVAREMTAPQGGFYSSQDADSEGEEGKFYVWTHAEIRAVLEDVAHLFCDAYGVTPRGNWEGRNILHCARDLDVVAATHHLTMEEVETRLERARQKLLAVRAQRVPPARDDKVLTAWNGLMLAAFACAARVLARDDYRALAERNAHFVLTQLRQPNGRLYRAWRAGSTRVNAYLEDYAHLAEGLLTLYETTFDARWFVAARALAEIILTHFADPRGGFFDTADDHEELIVRPQDVQDNAIPSGGAMATHVLLKLAAFTGDGRYYDAAQRALQSVQHLLATAPLGFAYWLCAYDFALSRPKEIAIIGTPQARHELLSVVWSEYRPNQVVACGAPEEVSPVPLLNHRPTSERATAFVCRNQVCQLPVTEPAALAEQLAT
jgi:uncharacterized protein YyaL (SSP411 family)